MSRRSRKLAAVLAACLCALALLAAEMDVPAYVGEDGLVHMDEINDAFPRFNWITSQTNMKDLRINGRPVLVFSDLPNHSFVTCEIEVQRRLLPIG